MKKILIVGLVFLSIFLIYLANMDKKVYYVALGDSLEKTYVSSEEVYGYSHYIKNYLKEKNILERYTDEFAGANVRSTDIINDINNNKKITTPKGSINIKNALIKADLVTINLNYDDIYSKLGDFSVINNAVYDYIDDLAYDLDNLFKLMREYCKEDIVFISNYNPYSDDEALDVLDYLNRKYKDVCLEYDVIYVDISDFDSLSSENLRGIGNMVIDKMSKSLFEA